MKKKGIEVPSTVTTPNGFEKKKKGKLLKKHNVWEQENILETVTRNVKLKSVKLE